MIPLREIRTNFGEWNQHDLKLVIFFEVITSYGLYTLLGTVIYSLISKGYFLNSLYKVFDHH